MAENIPLLPDKKNAVCADVREVLRETFRELDYLPSIINEQFGKEGDDQLKFDSDFLIRDLSKECKKLGEYEKELQNEYAKRLARDPLPNIYTLHSPRSPTEEAWKQTFGLLQRKDLKPSVEQNANYDKSLWVQNILNRSSGDFTVLTKMSPITRHVPLEPAHEYSLQSMSLGEIIPRAPPPPLPVPPPPEMPAFIVCIPSRVEFVNFSVGKLYTQLLRLVNTSTVEISLSVRPPPHQDLRVELRSCLAVTSGAAAEISVHFTPRSVRWVTEELSVRVSVGRSLVIPIRCYMEPPVLEILLRNVTSDIQTIDAAESVQDVLDLGTKLLGDVHREHLLFKSAAKHASFFILSEDSWQESNIEVVRNLTMNSATFGVVTDCFYISLAHWVGARGLGCSTCTKGVDCGCGLTRGTEGLVAARLTSAGTRVADIRIISSTGTVRSLNLVADALMFSPEHITIKAQEKDFDICSEGDPNCKYYVHLGTAFPDQSVSATVQVVNHSPLTYKYYWSSRKWGEDVSTEDLSDKLEPKKEFRVSVEKRNGTLLPHTRNPLSVHAADCGSALGTQKAVLMLILENIPRDSLPSDFDPIILDSHTVQEDAIPGISASWSREVCSVVCAQLEVWWAVVPVRFTVDPPFIRLYCSKRVNSISIPVRVTQLYGVTAIHVRRSSQKEPLRLIPGRSVTTTIVLPLQISNKPVTKVITFTSSGGEWSASTTIEYSYRPRGVTLEPVARLLRASPPNAAVSTDIALYNNTYQDLAWHATCHPWRDRAATCSGHVCSTCERRDCRCAALHPAGGEVAHAHDAILRYNITAPDVEGCFATLIEVTTEEKGEEVKQSNTAYSAALVAYRVLAPRLFLRVVPCSGDEKGDCLERVLDVGSQSVGVEKGVAVLRLLSLRCGARTCCGLCVWNITPLSTRVVWEQCEDDALKVTFLPNEFEVEGFAEANVTVLLEASKVCRRKLFVCRAHVTDAHPLYLLIDTSITGVEVTIEFPIGGDEHTDSFVTFKMIQREEFSNIFPDEMSTSIEDIFAKEELKREKQKQNVCDCPKKMVYIPPVKKSQPPKGPDEYSPIEIVDTPPLTCVCRCTFCSKPMLPEQTEPYCLQFRKLPLNTVRTRTVVLRSEGGTAARWRSAVRRWPRNRNARNMPWSFAPGVALQCAPAAGTLPPRGVVEVTVAACADSWGLYHDQIVIQVEHLEPIVIDVWLEVTGPPLQFALRPEADDDSPPVLWMSTSDPERSVRFTNTSRADLIIYPYLLKNHEYIQESLPFRLYLRLYDVIPPSCPCVTELRGDSGEQSKSSLFEEMDTEVELVLVPDYGVQDSSFYQVEPTQLQVKAHTSDEFRVRLLTPLREEAPQSTLLLRLLPVVVAKEGWYRPPPPPQLVHIRTAPRFAHLQASCSEIRISVCALDLPCNDIMRLRKHFSIRNTGQCAILTRHRTCPPWRAGRRARCCCTSTGMDTDTSLTLPPHSSTEMFVEVSVSAQARWPVHGRETKADYPVRRIETDTLSFYDTDDVLLLSIPLVLLIDQPRLSLEPSALDFGELCVGRSAKTYFTVTHSSPQATVEVVVSSTDEQFRVFPRTLELAPREKRRIYVQCTARYEPTTPGSDTHPTTASVLAQARGGRCRAAIHVTMRARLCSDSERPCVHEDTTDDMNLLPEDVCRYLNIE